MARDPQTRLVYSTGGETARDERPANAEKANRPEPAGHARTARVRLSLERRASDRQVTIVRGLTGSAEQIAELARALKAACGTGGSVKGGVIELQGDRRDAVEALLGSGGWRVRRSGG
jgi:translation initiation factor 1